MQYMCKCRTGYYSDRCQYVSKCKDCKNSVKCFEDSGHYICHCKHGFTDCQFDTTTALSKSITANIVLSVLLCLALFVLVYVFLRFKVVSLCKEKQEQDEANLVRMEEHDY